MAPQLERVLRRERRRMSNYNDHFDAEIERADRKIKETGVRVAAQLSRGGRITGRAVSQDGAITVTVGPGGRLLKLDIESSALALPPDRLAGELVKLAQHATRDANGRMHQSVRPVVSPEVARSLTELGIAPGASAEDAELEFGDMLRRQK